MSEQLRDHVTPLVQAAPDEISAERIGLESYLGFVREHKEIYRIIDEAEFVDYASYRSHYETTVARVRQRLEKGAARGEIRNDVSRSEEHTSELQSLMRISYAVFCLKKKKQKETTHNTREQAKLKK